MKEFFFLIETSKILKLFKDEDTFMKKKCKFPVE